MTAEVWMAGAQWTVTYFKQRAMPPVPPQVINALGAEWFAENMGDWFEKHR